MSLVLDSVDSTSSSPVDSLGEVGVIEKDWSLDNGALIHLVTKSLSTLFFSEGGEHVVTEGE